MHRFVVYGLLLLVVAGSAHAAPTRQESPTQVIEALNEALLEVMKNAESLGYEGRYAKLAPVIEKTHDLPFLAKFSLGPYWRGLNAAQRSRWLETFTDFSIATYAARFNGYAGESFKVVSEQPWKRGKMLVKSMLILPDEDDIEFQYILSEDGTGQWRIINVLVDGVSDLALKRAEYSTTVAKNGFDALLRELSQKISDYAKGKVE